MNATTTTPSTRFNPWPYAIIGYFVFFVMCVAAFITWAVRQDMDLVRKDYYDHEILFQQQIDRQKRALELGTQVAIGYDAALHAVTISLPASHASAANGNVRFYRPSDAKLDRELPLAPDTGGIQLIDTGELRPGLWKVAVQWTAHGKEYFLDRSIVVGG